MNSFTQLFIIFISFIYGMIFFLLTKYNLLITKKLNTFLKYLITFIFITDIVIIYIYLIYKINLGIFHIYFLLCMFLGYALMNNLYSRLIKVLIRIKKKMKKTVK